jgi:Fe-S oxidoreductase
VQVLPVIGAGRTLISKGFLTSARCHALRLLEAIRRIDPQGRLPVVGVEPSEIYTLCDEFPHFFPGDGWVQALARRSWMVDEFLIRPDRHGETYFQKIVPRVNVREDGRRVLLHGHCYQKARPPAGDGFLTGVEATVSLLEKAGFVVQLNDAGCCGMAGAFGYEVEHCDLSLHIGEMSLFPAVRAADGETIIAAAGTSCRAQIEDGTGRTVLHPIYLVYQEIL